MLKISLSNKETEEENSTKNNQTLLNKKSKSVFCCQQLIFYKKIKTDQDDLFEAFMEFEKNNQLPGLTKDDERGLQVVEKENFGPIKGKRYFFLPCFEEISEDEFKRRDFKRLSSFENRKCNKHKLFFEINAYKQGSAVSNRHSSTVNGATYRRNTSEIDVIAPGIDKGERLNKKLELK